MVSNVIAEKLEDAGLWRRAAARWLAVMDRCETDAQREGSARSFGHVIPVLRYLWTRN
ncbi:PerC family transcriptional regulator [Citrobacter sp. ESBL3]|uniref:PerC family transcriptional regulator n=1 Tax=Citrobacter sp. ESBL3 TaxID=3077326 RepID=UPI002FCA6A14